MILEKLAGPLIGAVIGYCTNYIAVKMLFYPKLPCPHTWHHHKLLDSELRETQTTNYFSVL